MVMHNTFNHLGEFNRLDERPEPLLPEKPSEAELIAAFPFIFKPNRVLALHPHRGQSEDPGWPCHNGDKHWMIKLRIPASLALPVYLATLSQYGKFSLWQYQEGAQSGLHPIPLRHGETEIQCSFLSLEKDQKNKDDIPACAKITLIRISQHTEEEEELHHIRIETSQSIFTIELDLNAIPSEPSIQALPYRLTQHEQPQHNKPKIGPNQIGGWSGGKIFHWDNTDRVLIEGNPRNSAHHNNDIIFRVRAAEREGQRVIVGGECTQLMACEQAMNQNPVCQLKSHIYSLAIIPSTAQHESYIFAGCDDHNIYILDWQGHTKKKIMMGGIVEGIIFLHQQAGTWIDVAIRVRTIGLFCARLFIDCLQENPPFANNREDFHTALTELIAPNPIAILQKWFSTPKKLPQQLIALTLLTYHPVEKTISCFFNDKNILQKIEYPAIEFWVYTLYRAVLQCLNQKTDWREGDLLLYLTLLTNIASGPERARMAIRQLEGWLLTLLLDEPWEKKELKKQINALHTQLPDAKRWLRRLASNLYQEKNEERIDRYLSLFVSTYNRIHFDGFFNELILRGREQTGPVPVVAMIGTMGKGKMALVRVHRNDTKLRTFYLDANENIIQPKIDEKHWAHCLHPKNEPMQAVQCLLPLNETHLLVVTEYKVGIAVKDNTEIHWHKQKFAYPLRCAALFYNKKTTIIAIGSIFNPQIDDCPAVYLFELEQATLKPKNKLFPSKNIDPQYTIQNLAWDQQGNLWGVTSCQGILCCWSSPLSTAPAFKVIKRIDASQYALTIVDDLIVCGGEDGVVRGFYANGMLAWNFITSGSVRALRTLTPSPSDSNAPLIAVISEKEHLYTLNANGQQCGLLFIPQRHLLSLCARVLREKGQMHYFIGTLEGGVRLIETVVQTWPETHYLGTAHHQDDYGIAWSDVKNNLEKELVVLLRPKKLQAWCEVEAASEEPMRSAWAARQLVDTFNTIDPVLTMLKHFDGKFDPDIIKLRAMCFSVLAPKLHQLTVPQKQRIRILCENARDGAIASMVTHSPKEKDQGLFPLLLPILVNRVIDGAPFTSAALLHILRNEGWRESLESLLIQLLEKDSLAGLHRGFLSGLLSIFFHRLETPGKNDLIRKLARISNTYPSFGRHLLITKNHHCFCDWLVKYGLRIFSIEDQQAWKIVAPHLSETASIETSIKKIIHTTSYHSQHADQGYSIAAMIDHLNVGSATKFTEWQKWQKLDSQIIIEKKEIVHGQRYGIKLQNKIQQMKNRLAQYTPDIPLFSPLQVAWKKCTEQSLNELEIEQNNQPKTNLLKLSYDTLWVVDGEPAPLCLRLTNQGQDDLEEMIRFGLDKESTHLVNAHEPTEISSQGLTHPKEGPLGQALTLNLFLLSPFDKDIALKVFWSVGKQCHNENITIKATPRWTKYQDYFPGRDALAYHLFSKKEQDTFKYHRIIIKRFPYTETEFLDRETLTKLIDNWAERIGRQKELRIINLEQKQQNAESFSKDIWQEKLQTKPLGLEVWIVEKSIPWNLTFLTVIDHTADTALLLPDLIVEDTQKPSEMFQLLSETLCLHEANQLNILQWALKACTQSVSDTATQNNPTDQPTYLGRAVLHGKDTLPRAITPSQHIWSTKKGAWPIAGVSGPRDDSALAPDPAKALGVLVPADAFRFLFRMGLVRHWRKRYWTPRASILFQYVDASYPTQTTGNGPKHTKEGSPWRWLHLEWNANEIEYARNVLFGKHHQPPMFPPYQGFNFKEWGKIRDHGNNSPSANDFFHLIGLEGRAAYHQILHSQPTWSKLLEGDPAAHSSFIRRLENDHISVIEHPLQEEAPYCLLWLTVEGLTNRFRQMLLVLPKADFYSRWESSRNSKVRSVQLLMEQICKKIKIGGAILLMVYDWPSNRNHEKVLKQQEIVFLNARRINRLMVCQSPAETLVDIAKAQVSLSSLSQSIFQIHGAVDPHRFFGRSSELDQLDSGLLAGKSFVITGPRSIGKSSLLAYFTSSSNWKARLKDKYYPISIDLQNQRTGLNYGNFLHGLLSTMVHPPANLASAIEKIRARKDPLSVARDQTLIYKILDLSEKVFEEIERFANKRRPLFLLDESDGFYNYDKQAGEHLFTLFRQYHSEGRAQFIFASYPEKAESMAKELIHASNQSYNFLTKIELGTFKTQEAISLVQSGMNEVGLRCNTQQSKWIVKNTFAIPNLTQKTCHELCLALEQQISAEEGEELHQSLLDQVILEAQKYFLDVLLAQLEQKNVKYFLYGLVVDNKNKFTLEEATEVFLSFAGGIHDKKKVEKQLKELLRTLILSYTDGFYYFSGDILPYFPTMLLNAYTKEELESDLLQQIEKQEKNNGK